MGFENLLNNRDYISIDDVIHEIHKHIGGKREDFEKAKQILRNIIEKELEKTEKIKVYENSSKLWKEVEYQYFQNEKYCTFTNTTKGLTTKSYKHALHGIIDHINSMGNPLENDYPF